MKDAAVNQRQLPKSKADVHKNDIYLEIQGHSDVKR